MGGMVMISYVLLDGVNDSDACAREVVELLRSRPVILNLIPYNSFEGNKYAYEAPSAERTDAFLKIVLAADIRVFERRHHGRDIAAACGQLARIEKKPVDLEDLAACDGGLTAAGAERPAGNGEAPAPCSGEARRTLAQLGAVLGTVACIVALRAYRHRA
eukprot:NODE_5181_length_606_cov_11.170599.p2 GENE.NODE_5181_length_606_cov_11.170599~~NODE_5181_length_606_cov_11.170599.p2  ORF type:complete len:160 (+),score=52.57 NODE_5181_length_606_cov_11.170599:3-482(+)